MTEKRYKRHLSFVLDDYANGSDRLMTIREVIPRLNELYEENEQLKSKNRGLQSELQIFKEDVTHSNQIINKLNDENEQLKQYIYDNLDEDICDVCSYQYLEKSQMDKYYVAKCKKGYDNCSKGTVIHCKDFKFKELQE